MSGRVASTSPKLRATALVAFVALGGFACGLLATLGGSVAAQPVSPKDAVEDIDKTDKRTPVPADAPGQIAVDKLKVKNPDRAIFAAIEDFKPVAAQDKNPREYDAWTELVLHASQQNVRELERYAARDLVPLDLIRSARANYRTELLRFDGKLICIRRLVPPPLLKVAGITELYEARFVPVDESPLTPVSIVFLDVPESLAAVRGKKEDEWLDADGWITASGYFFKTMSVPGERANATVAIPLLIGKGITPLTGPPVPAGNPTALDKDLRIYKFIKDDAGMIRNNPTEETWPEVAAQNRVVVHASRFSAEDLENYARTGLKFPDLFEATRVDHKLACVKLEGRLISLKRVEVNEWLLAAGVTQLFEGWLIPENEPRGNPVCILFTEPLEGVEPTGRVNKWVSFAGYSFKLMRYESAERFEDEPNRNKVKKAPLLIGRSPIPRRDPDTPTSVTWGVFVNAAIVGGALLIIAAGVLTWWYRGGDRKAKQQMDAVRHRNPFDANSAPSA